jgi:hypothetical protein
VTPRLSPVERIVKSIAALHNEAEALTLGELLLEDCPTNLLKALLIGLDKWPSEAKMVVPLQTWPPF